MGKFGKLAVSVILCEGIGIVGSFFTAPSIPLWYVTLIKPAFTPPSWLFGPVWTTLFLLMGISLFLIWEKGVKNKRNKAALTFFGIQLLLNLAWSIIFFGLHLPFFALLEITLLWVFILLTTLYFWQISKTAALLLLPYLLWVSFASYLNYMIWLLNK